MKSTDHELDTNIGFVTLLNHFYLIFCLCHLLDQNFFGQPKIIWLAKNIKILYNEGPENFG